MKLSKRKTHEQYFKEFNEVHSGKINLIGIYSGVNNKLEVDCIECDHKWKANPSNLLRGTGCPKCAANKMAKLREKTNEQFVNEITDLVGNEYTVLTKYIHSLEKIKIKHNLCNYIYEVTPNNFIHGKRCPNCTNHKKRTDEEFKSEVFDIVGNEYSVIGKFVNVRTKIEINHHVCNKNFKMLPNHFLNGQRCPYCAKDKKYGENSHFWKGGISPIVHRLRGFISPWKLDSLKEHNFICVLSNINDGTLEVHHLNKNFSEITYEVFKLLNLQMYDDMSNYTQKEINLIKEKLLELHYSYGLGVPLTSELHQKFHSIYGRSNNTSEQFDEFKKNYTNKETNVEVAKQAKLKQDQFEL